MDEKVDVQFLREEKAGALVGETEPHMFFQILSAC